MNASFRSRRINRQEKSPPRQSRRQLKFFFLLLLPIAFSSISCKPAPEETPADVVTIRGAGATFPAILYKEWFRQYEESHDGVRIDYDAVGSGEGERRFIGKDEELTEEELVDFGASDAGLTDAQIAEVERGAMLIPATGGVLVLAYNLPGVEGQLNLPRDVYAGIFLGEITEWNDEAIVAANPGLSLPNLTIVPVVRRDSSGTTFAFTNHLSAISERWRERFGPLKLVAWPGRAMPAMGNEGVAGRIKQSVGAIGYVQYGYAERGGLKMAALENKAGNYVMPTDRSGQATLDSAELPESRLAFFPDPEGEDSYPIVTLTWILLYEKYDDAAKAQAVRDLFHWCLDEGQASATKFGYLPLTDAVIADGKRGIDSVRP